MTKTIYLNCTFLLAVVALVATTACGRSKASVDDSIKAGDKLVTEKKIQEAILVYRTAVQADQRHAVARRRLGEAYLLTGELTNASQELVRAADLSPADQGLQLEAGRALLSIGLFEDAGTRAEGVLKTNPKNVDAHLLRAAAAANLKDVEGALSALETAQGLDKTRSSIYIDQAALQARSGRLDEAEAGFKQALAVAPTSVNAHLAYANFLLLTGKRPQSEDLLKKAVGLDPKSPRANLALVTFYLTTGRMADAEVPLKAASDAAPNDISLKLTLADYYVTQKKLDSALPILQALRQDKSAAAAAGARLAGVDYDQGRVDAAYKQVDALIKASPENSQLLVLKANWRLQERKFDEALSLAQTAAKADPRSADAQLLLGKAYVALSDPIQAEKAFNAALQVRPDVPEALEALAYLNIQRGRPDAALTAARQAVASAPRDGAARLALAQALFAHGDVVSADAELKLLLPVMSKVAAVTELKGRIQLRNGQTAAAHQTFTEALEQDPSNASALKALVQMDLTAKRPADAVRTLETYLPKANRADVLVIAGRTYAATGDLARSEAALRKAIDLDPSAMEAYHVLGQIFVRQHRLDDAVKAYEARLTERPNDVGIHTMVGMIQLAQGKQAQAQERFEKALSIDPRAPVASNNLAYIDADAGTNLDIALNRAQTAKAALPNEPDVNDTLGWVYVQRGLPALAMELLGQAVAARPAEPVYHYHLGMAHLKAGDKERARPELERALQLSSAFPGADKAREALGALGR